VIQKPKVAPYISEMINNISIILGIEQGRINIKATTEEGLGFTGSSEGVSAHAVVLVKNKG
jgi:2-C-methyl-D-erythritol 2,4-cyclodiphosphate synthase